nr:Coiled-coil domain-containing protein 96 [Polyrhizophydium stewartii]
MPDDDAQASAPPADAAPRESADGRQAADAAADVADTASAGPDAPAGAPAADAAAPAADAPAADAGAPAEEKDLVDLESTLRSIRADTLEQSEQMAANEQGITILDASAAISAAGEPGTAQPPEGESAAAEQDGAAPAAAADKDGFPCIAYSEDRVHPLAATMRTITSPVPADYDASFPFMNVDYEADPEVLYFGLATIMSRSASAQEVADEGMAPAATSASNPSLSVAVAGTAASISAAKARRNMAAAAAPPDLIRPTSPTMTSFDHPPGEHAVDGHDADPAGDHLHPGEGDASAGLGDSHAGGDLQDGTGDAQQSQSQQQQHSQNQGGQNQQQQQQQGKLPDVPPEVEIDREAIITSIKQNLELKDKLMQRNAFLQNKLGEYFKKKRSIKQTDDTRDGEKSVSDQEQRYANCMSSLNELRAEYNTLNVTNQKIVSEYKSKLEERLEEVTAKADEFCKYKRTVALGAENSRTGKPLPVKVVEQLESTERKKENEVVAVRLENIKLRNKLRRHEQLLRQKEELADGLHLIDFEQLKIENQTYNEKIEERNEELLKLRKKITNVVQVLTHVKEKLQFVQGETVELKQQLKNLDEDVTQRRDSLPLAKQERDSLRNTNTVLRQKNGLLGNNNLLHDYGEKVDDSKGLKARIDDLQRYYAELVSETQRLRRRMQKAQLIAHMNVVHAVE